MNGYGLPDLVVPLSDQVCVIHRLWEAHQLQMAHYHCEHGVNKNLVRDNSRNQSTSMILIFLMFPVTPSNRIKAQARVNVAEYVAALGRLGGVHRCNVMLHPTGLISRAAVGVNNRLAVNGQGHRVAVIIPHDLLDGLARLRIRNVFLVGTLLVHVHIQAFAVFVIRLNKLMSAANAYLMRGVVIRLNGFRCVRALSLFV